MKVQKMGITLTPEQQKQNIPDYESVMMQSPWTRVQMRKMGKMQFIKMVRENTSSQIWCWYMVSRINKAYRRFQREGYAKIKKICSYN